MKTHSIKTLRDARDNSAESINYFPNVKGTMIGKKYTGGKCTDSKCLIVLVKQKIHASDLHHSEIIPESISFNGKKIQTDILELGDFLHQSTDNIFFCSDGRTRATVSGFAKSNAGIFGVTCAHALAGSDRRIATTDEISLWFPEKEQYLVVGRSGPAIWHNGFGIATDYGFADVGIFTIERNDILEKLSERLVGRASTMINLNSSLYIDTGHGRLAGVVQGVEAQFENFYCDVIIKVDQIGTFEGDSGATWRNESGLPVAIHALGSAMRPGLGSLYSACMLISRAEKLLNIRFLKI